MKKHNFSAGPCILAPEVFQKSAEAILDFDGMGLSLIEISHRSPAFVKVMDRAVNLVKQLLEVPDTHEVLFLQGGASLEFLMAPLNFMKEEGGKAVYLETGTWAKKAIAEAKRYGKVEVVGSSADSNFNFVPKGYQIPEDADYFHCTSNNTIFGTQMKDFPQTDVPVVCDMSSDIFSRQIDVSKFALIYAGAQKNLGPAGTTLVIVNKELLGKTGRDIPTMLNYETHIKGGSMFNTPPVFAVYASMLTLEWLEKNGGIAAMQKKNEDKAALLYKEIDENPLFEGTAHRDDRSLMNVTFLLTDDSLKEKFDELWNAAGISGIKGHRSVGGYRASIYNAMPVESVERLISVMKELKNIAVEHN